MVLNWLISSTAEAKSPSFVKGIKVEGYFSFQMQNCCCDQAQSHQLINKHAQRVQLPLKGKGHSKNVIFMLFLLQYDNVSLIWCHCDVIQHHIEKTKGVLYSSHHALSYDMLLNMVS